MVEKEKLKVAIIAGASGAARFKEKNPRASEADVINHITKQIEIILAKIDEELK
ncbi:hypothetical protein J4217_01230 [Candidatus Pacearchaeota archaeon]|nr:hypothetical protein [Candidatus Pacearchaeota archaeon]